MELTELERRCVDRLRSGADVTDGPSRSTALGWLEFCIDRALEAGRRIRHARQSDLRAMVERKADGSPMTRLELVVEEGIVAHLKAFAPEASLVAEELGGILPEQGSALAVDPIDGTWAYLGRTEMAATSIAAFDDRVPVAAVLMNPATGELLYTARGTGTRLLQLSTFGEPHQGWDLPLPGEGPGRPIVNARLSSAKDSGAIALIEAWSDGRIGALRSARGSPAWGLASAAKGSSTYADSWIGSAAAAYDLAAAILLVRNAGGEVMDLSGRPVPAVGHTGTLVAGLDSEHLEVVAGLLREAGAS
jgi:fructose-1,6-bisphosphatase/inositol monophosphatase family enzyme